MGGVPEPPAGNPAGVGCHSTAATPNDARRKTLHFSATGRRAVRRHCGQSCTACQGATRGRRNAVTRADRKRAFGRCHFAPGPHTGSRSPIGTNRIAGGPTAPGPAAGTVNDTIRAAPGCGVSAPNVTKPTAPLLRRLAALVYESLLLGALLLLTGLALAALVSPTPGSLALRSPQIPTLPARFLMFVALFTVTGGYYVWSWTGSRRSLPMKTWKLSLVRNDGRPPDARTAFTRYVAAWIGPVLAIPAYVALQPTGHARLALWLLGLNYAWALVDRDRRFLHDRIAQTRLVDDRPRQRPAQEARVRA